MALCAWLRGNDTSEVASVRAGLTRSLCLPVCSEIGDIAGVADVTIRQSYRLIYPRAPDLFPPDFKFDTPVDKLPQLWRPPRCTLSEDTFCCNPRVILSLFYHTLLDLERLFPSSLKTPSLCLGTLAGIQRTHIPVLKHTDSRLCSQCFIWVYIACIYVEVKTCNKCFHNFRLVSYYIRFSFFCRKNNLVLFC